MKDEKVAELNFQNTDESSPWKTPILSQSSFLTLLLRRYECLINGCSLELHVVQPEHTSSSLLPPPPTHIPCFFSSVAPTLSFNSLHLSLQL